MDKDIPVLNFDEMVDWIESETEYDRSTIECILDMETEWMRQVGIITITDDKSPEE